MDPMIMNFLKELQKNNNREWFQKNKSLYENAKAEFESFINTLIPEIARFDSSLKFISAGECMFRIYRDVRFSKNKEPYKTNFGAWMAQGGRKSSGPGYYFHMEPGQVFLSGGIYMPDPDLLKRIRHEIYYSAADFHKVFDSKPFRKYFSGLDDYEVMKKPPKDFPPDFPDIDLLKYKSYTVSYPMDEKDLLSPKLLSTAVLVYKSMHPFNEFLRRAKEV